MLKSTLLVTAALGFAISTASAQDFTAVSTIEKVVVVETADDETKTVEFVKADRVTPGDNLFYQIAYENGTEDAVEDVNLVMNVPAEVTYAENSAGVESSVGGNESFADAGISVLFSTDGGETFYPRGELSVSADGRQRVAVTEDITNIQFAFSEPIIAGASGTVSFSAVVR